MPLKNLDLVEFCCHLPVIAGGHRIESICPCRGYTRLQFSKGPLLRRQSWIGSSELVPEFIDRMHCARKNAGWIDRACCEIGQWNCSEWCAFRDA